MPRFSLAMPAMGLAYSSGRAPRLSRVWFAAGDPRRPLASKWICGEYAASLRACAPLLPLAMTDAQKHDGGSKTA